MSGLTLSRNETYLTIGRRLALLNPPIYIEDHIKFDPTLGRKTLKAGDPPPGRSTLEIKTSTLDGINFVPVDADELMKAIRAVVDLSGSRAFVEGTKASQDNKAVAASFGATEGIGFREVWHIALSVGTLMPDEPRIDPYAPSYARNQDNRLTFAFNDTIQTETSLHIAVSPNRCNIHIDEQGFTMRALDGTVFLTPGVFQHIFNELVLKTFPEHHVAQFLIDRTSLNLPNPSNNFYLGVGVSFDVVQTRRYRLRFTSSCFDLKCHDRAATLSFSGTFGASQ